jgi:hypothetical protein
VGKIEVNGVAVGPRDGLATDGTALRVKALEDAEIVPVDAT